MADITPWLSHDLLGIPDPQYYIAIGRCGAACCAIFGGRDDLGIWKTCGFCGRQVMMIEGEDDKPEFVWMSPQSS